MMRLAMVLMSSLIFGACTPSGAPTRVQLDPADQIAKGQTLARLNCMRCHAIGASGESLNPDSPPFRQLYERYPGPLLDDAFPQRMKVGHPAMPQFEFTDDETAALLRYIKNLQQQKAA